MRHIRRCCSQPDCVVCHGVLAQERGSSQDGQAPGPGAGTLPCSQAQVALLSAGTECFPGSAQEGGIELSAEGALLNIHLPAANSSVRTLAVAPANTCCAGWLLKPSTTFLQPAQCSGDSCDKPECSAWNSCIVSCWSIQIQVLAVATGGFVGCWVPSSPAEDRTKMDHGACL